MFAQWLGHKWCLPKTDLFHEWHESHLETSYVQYIHECRDKQTLGSCIVLLQQILQGIKDHMQMIIPRPSAIWFEQYQASADNLATTGLEHALI